MQIQGGEAMERKPIHFNRRQQLQSGAIPYPIPSHYNLFLFFGSTNLLGLSVILCMARFVVQNVQPLEWLTLPATFFLANFVEYVFHRGPMHKPTRFMKLLFKVHTRSHHEYFTHEMMNIEESKEAYKVLFFFRDNFTLLGLITPLFLFIGYIANRNIAGFTIITLVGYYLLYEWLHLAYHAPARLHIDRLPLLGALKRHHQIHHDKAHMNRYNFNLTLPIWDVILGTLYQGEEGESEKVGK
jgi:sterol desaturase/sphingolipid hydroxylase (fatty acid hydroxylase superfamily)